jgi:hypothetical protein
LLAWTSEPITDPVSDSSTASGSSESTGASEPMTSMAASSLRWAIWDRILRMRSAGSSVPMGAARLTPVNRLPPAGSDSARRFTGTAMGSVATGTPRPR